MSIDIINDVISVTQNIQGHMDVLGYIIALLWGVFVLNLLLGGRLLILGIIPRNPLGIPGILFAPLLHANFNHLFFNTIPLIVLSAFVLIQGFYYYVLVTILITMTSGLLIWMFAKPGIHIGASALITGYWSLLVTNMFSSDSIIAIAIGFVSIYYFAGIFFGIFPKDKGVSWEGHMFGLVAGVCTTYLTSQNLWNSNLFN